MSVHALKRYASVAGECQSCNGERDKLPISSGRSVIEFAIAQDRGTGSTLHRLCSACLAELLAVCTLAEDSTHGKVISPRQMVAEGGKRRKRRNRGGKVRALPTGQADALGRAAAASAPARRPGPVPYPATVPS